MALTAKISITKVDLNILDYKLVVAFNIRLKIIMIIKLYY